MAAAIFNNLARKLDMPLSAASAGTEPSDHAHPNVVRVMDEWGIDLSQNRPQLLTNDMAESARRVITMGCEVGEAECPALFLKDIEDWGLPDPAGKGLDETREVRNEIYRKVLNLALEMSESGDRRELLTKLLQDCE